MDWAFGGVGREPAYKSMAGVRVVTAGQVDNGTSRWPASADRGLIGGPGGKLRPAVAFPADVDQDLPRSTQLS